MPSISELYHALTDPQRLIALLSSVLGGWYGYLLLFAVVFSETGLLVGFFLPGDSLLFTVGVVAGAGHLNIILINLLLIAAAILGDGVGYALGRQTGPRIFSRPDSTLFKQQYVHQTQAFYEKHGGKTIIYARFVPIVRTFAPFIAGVGNMSYQRFLSFNIFGGIGWVVLMTTLGFTLGGVAIVQRNFEKVILGIIFVSILPVLFEIFRARKKQLA